MKFLEENKDFLNECMNIINTTIYKVFKIDINDEQEKQILGAYLFGMFNGLGHEKILNLLTYKVL